MGDVPELSPDERQDDRGADEGEPIAYRLPTRPCSSVGTARMRTVREVVPQTNAWAPKTNVIAIATHAVVVRARPRWVKVSMTSPTRIMFARLA